MKVKIATVVFCALCALDVNAWICTSCHDPTAWPETARGCGRCGARKPQPKPVYTPPPQIHVTSPTYTSQPSSPPRKSATQPTDPSWYWPGYGERHRVHLTPFQLGVLGQYVAIPPGEYYSVYGICANALCVEVVDVYGLQVAYAFAVAKRNMCGFQVACGVTAENMWGVQVGPVIAGAQNACLLQLGGLFSLTQRNMRGIQMAAINRAGELRGMQLGGLNIAESASGVQIGAINYAGQMSGVQIGAINVIGKSPVPFMPVLNMHF